VPAFNATLQLDEPADVVQARIDATLRSSIVRKDTTVNSQPGSIVVIRRYTPGWAIVLGILGLFLFLLGLLFFLVKNTQSLTISISSRAEGGCTVMASGEAEEWVIRNVQAAFAGTSPVVSRSQVVRNAQLGKLNK
jgi:hypothetical protein